MNQKRSIAAFDFDGTLTKKDSLFEFLLFTQGKWRTFLGLVILSPAVMAMFLGIIDNNRCKEIMLSYFFKGWRQADFELKGREFVTRGKEILNPETCAKLRKHLNEGHEVYIISASVEEWVKPIAETLGVKNVLCTRLAVGKDGILTGRYQGKNCHGQEKVNRLLQADPDRDTYYLYAYGDSNGDKQLFDFADEATRVG